MPVQVLLKAQQQLLDYNDSGMSVMEMSHRSSTFKTIIDTAYSNLTKLLDIPSNYKILFMHGGGHAQFSAVVYNLVTKVEQPVDYIVTGAWSEEASREAKRIGANVNIVFSTKDSNHDGSIKTFNFSNNPAYIYYCDNETIHGVEMNHDFVDSLPKATIICDMSSNILSRKVNIAKFGVIFAAVTKNIGPPALSIAIVRQDLIGNFDKCPFKGPLILNYKVMADFGSMYNTPPTYSIYMSGLVFEHLLESGGIDYFSKLSDQKSKLLYDTLSKHSIYNLPVKKEYRSRMNVVFTINDKEKQVLFLKGAQERGMVGLEGHRSVGGIRASIYNAVSLESVEILAQYIEDFALNKV